MSMSTKPQTRTRNEAILTGDRRFYTGLPCRKGHLSERYTSTGGCISCLRPALAFAQLKGRVDPRYVYQPPTIILDSPLPSARVEELNDLMRGWVVHTLRKWQSEADALRAENDRAVAMGMPAPTGEPGNIELVKLD